MPTPFILHHLKGYRYFSACTGTHASFSLTAIIRLVPKFAPFPSRRIYKAIFMFGVTAVVRILGLTFPGL